MRLLYVFQQPRSATSGLSIYDKRMSAALEALGHKVVRVALEENGPLAGYLGILRYQPPAIARYQSSRNSRLVEQALKTHHPDAIVLSHESTLFLVEQAIVPRDKSIILCHNIMAPGYRSRRTPADSFYARLFYQYERRLARAGVPVTAISEYDRVSASREYGLSMAALCPPGTLPGCEVVPETAQLDRVMTISGNYDWRLKRQDLLAFFDEFESSQMSKDIELYLSTGAAKYASEGLQFREGLPSPGRIGVGLVVDRFEAGFKLKLLEYVSHGFVIASYCDLAGEFEGIADADLFVRKISHAVEIATLCSDIEKVPNYQERFRTFQQNTFNRYRWRNSARSLAAILEG